MRNPQNPDSSNDQPATTQNDEPSPTKNQPSQPSYYYDDATGYEIYHEGSGSEEDDEDGTDKK